MTYLLLRSYVNTLMLYTAMPTKRLKHIRTEVKPQRGKLLRIDAETHRLLKSTAALCQMTMIDFLAQLVAAAAKNRRPALSHE